VTFRRAAERVIEHGSITRYVVENGELGFAWKDGHVCEILPGIGITDDPNFKFVRNHKLNESVIQFGNIAHVTTREGYRRPVYVDGKLVILGSGYRKFNEANLIVGDAFPTGEIIKPVTTLEVLTRDRTPMLVTGQVTYQICNANDLILNLGYAKLEPYIEHTLSAILRHAFSITVDDHTQTRTHTYICTYTHTHTYLYRTCPPSRQTPKSARRLSVGRASLAKRFRRTPRRPRTLCPYSSAMPRRRRARTSAANSSRKSTKSFPGTPRAGA
jgi:hypothetical protein